MDVERRRCFDMLRNFVRCISRVIVPMNMHRATMLMRVRVAGEDSDPSC